MLVTLASEMGVVGGVEVDHDRFVRSVLLDGTAVVGEPHRQRSFSFLNVCDVCLYVIRYIDLINIGFN